MDKTTHGTDPPQLAAAAKAARELGLGFEIVERKPILGNTRAEAQVRITADDAAALYAAVVVPAVPKDTVGPTLMQLERLRPQALLVTDHVTPPVAERLREARVAFIDAAGNAYLRQPGLLVWVTGRKRAAKVTAPAFGRAFQRNGLQVLFVLLCDPTLVNAPFRKLAEMAGVAHGTVGMVMKDLQAQGFVVDLNGKRGTRRLLQRARLLDLWTDAYVRLLRPRTLLKRFYVRAIDDWRTWNPGEHGAEWGGEPAAALLTDYLRPGDLTFYADEVPGTLAALKGFAVEPDPGRMAVVEVRRRFWKLEKADVQEEVVPPVLVYADLVATADARCLEVARMIRDTHVARLLGEG